MRRELRRHPVQAKPARGSNRPVRMPRGTPARGSGAGPVARGRMANLPRVAQPAAAWFQDIFSELKKVQWPTMQETLNLTMVVVVVATALGVFLGGLDFTFNWVIENTLLR